VRRAPEKSLSVQIAAGDLRRYTLFEKGWFVEKFPFEIHDQPWFPASLRDQTTDALPSIHGGLFGLVEVLSFGTLHYSR
jgi:hypothetical protein